MSRQASCRHVAGCLAAGVLLSGCAAGRNDFAFLNPDLQYSPRPAEASVVLTTTDIEGPYVELGVIHVSGISREGYQRLHEKLRVKAREVGADAVIFVRYGTENVFSIVPFFLAIPYDVLTAEGLAVRSKQR